MSDRSDSTPASTAALLLRELFRLIMEQSAGALLRVMAEAGLSMPQLVSLHLLRGCGPHTISALAEKLDLSLAATSHLVERLVQLGFVVRSEDRHDRRQKQVAITPAGLALLERLLEARLAKAGQAAAALSPELQSQLVAVLGQLLEQLRE